MTGDMPILLIDASGIIFRAFYSIRELTSPDGLPTNAVYGVLLQVLRILKDLEPRACAVFFDSVGPTFREKEYADYKVQRPRPPDELIAQFPIVVEAFEKADCPVYLESGFEADDLIASFAEKHKESPKVILTGDKDMLQLLDKDTRVLIQTKGVRETNLYTVTRFQDEYGFPPGAFVDFKALRGDPSDNIPGVPGVGEKTAMKLVATYGNLEGIYERLNDIKPERIRDAIRNAREDVFRYRYLVTLRRDCELPRLRKELRLPDFSRQEFLGFCDRFDLKAIRKQVEKLEL